MRAAISLAALFLCSYIWAQNLNTYQAPYPYENAVLPRKAFTPYPTPVPVLHDTSSSTSMNGTQTASPTFTIAANNNRFLIVGITFQDDVNCSICGATIAGITYAAANLTFFNQRTTVPPMTQYIYYLKAPASGANTLSISFTDLVDAVVGYSSFYNVNQTTPLGVPKCAASTSGSTAPASLIVPTIPGYFVWDVLSIATATSVTATVNPVQTQLYNAVTGPVGNKITGAGSREPGLGGTTMSWSLDQSKPWVDCAVAVLN